MTTDIQSSIPRCQFGLLANVSELFTGLRYVRSIIIKGHGSELDKDPGEVFISFDHAPDLPRCWLGEYATVCKPSARMLEQFGEASNIGSVRVTPWRGTGHALITASYRDYPGDPWLAFVPMASVAELVPSRPAAMPRTKDCGNCPDLPGHSCIVCRGAT